MRWMIPMCAERTRGVGRYFDAAQNPRRWTQSPSREHAHDATIATAATHARIVASSVGIYVVGRTSRHEHH